MLDLNLEELDKIYCSLLKTESDILKELLTAPEEDYKDISNSVDKIRGIKTKIQKEAFRLEDELSS